MEVGEGEQRGALAPGGEGAKGLVENATLHDMRRDKRAGVRQVGVLAGCLGSFAPSVMTTRQTGRTTWFDRRSDSWMAALRARMGAQLAAPASHGPMGRYGLLRVLCAHPWP